MSEIIPTTPIALPAPTTPMTVRVATREDMPFMDRLQKRHSKALGFFSRQMLEGYIDGRNVLIAEATEVDSDKLIVDRRDASSLSTPNYHLSTPLGYVISKDRYLRRDELGAIFQMCVAPGHERQFIAANLLREVFERSAYGCRLYCCWCAQDLPANKFWEAMGFVPIAFRQGGLARRAGGSRRVGKIDESVSRDDATTHRLADSTTHPLNDSSKHRVHIFWQKRIRAGDTTTPYWFPAKTEGGAIREDRIILPIPPGMHWTEALPVLMPQGTGEGRVATEATARAGGRRAARQSEASSGPGPSQKRCYKRVLNGSTRFAQPGAGLPVSQGESGADGPRLQGTAPVPEPVTPTSARSTSQAGRSKPKADPALIAKARELRDRWMEHVDAHGLEGPAGKYEVRRSISGSGERRDAAGLGQVSGEIGQRPAKRLPQADRLAA